MSTKSVAEDILHRAGLPCSIRYSPSGRRTSWLIAACAMAVWIESLLQLMLLSIHSCLEVEYKIQPSTLSVSHYFSVEGLR